MALKDWPYCEIDGQKYAQLQYRWRSDKTHGAGQWSTWWALGPSAPETLAANAGQVEFRMNPDYGPPKPQRVEVEVAWQWRGYRTDDCDGEIIADSGWRDVLDGEGELFDEEWDGIEFRRKPKRTAEEIVAELQNWRSFGIAPTPLNKILKGDF